MDGIQSDHQSLSTPPKEPSRPLCCFTRKGPLFAPDPKCRAHEYPDDTFAVINQRRKFEFFPATQMTCHRETTILQKHVSEKITTNHNCNSSIKYATKPKFPNHAAEQGVSYFGLLSINSPVPLPINHSLIL